jgi:ABC-type Na+ efflux pump permease subunit
MDLRYPIGGLFTALGLILTGWGVATSGNAEMYARSDAVNINLWWGVVMFVFGLLLLALAARAGRIAARAP